MSQSAPNYCWLPACSSSAGVPHPALRWTSSCWLGSLLHGGRDCRQFLDPERFTRRLHQCASVEPVALVAVLEVALDLLGLQVPGGPPRDPEALVEQRAAYALGKAVGSRRLRAPVAVAKSA